MKRLRPDDVRVTAPDGGALGPLVALADFKAHSGMAGDAAEDSKLTAKLQAATDWIEGWNAYCRTWFRPVKLTCTWSAYYQAKTGVWPMLLLPGPRPDRATFGITIDGDAGSQAVGTDVSVEHGRWLAWLTDPRTLRSTERLTGQWTAGVGEDVPAMVAEVCMKLAAALVVDPGVASVLGSGDGVAFRRVRELLSPFVAG